MLQPERDVTAERVKLQLEVVERFLNLLDRPREILFVEHDLSAAVADKFVVRLKPSDASLERLAALRAVNFNLGVVEVDHSAAPVEPAASSGK
jgi:hypothetical protein